MKNIFKFKAKSFFLLILSCVLVAAITGVYALVWRPEADSREGTSVQERRMVKDNESSYNAAETEITPQLQIP